MNILCTVDIASREVALPAGVKIAAFDHNVDVISFYIEPIEGFSLDTATIRIAAMGPDGERHDYMVDSSTVSTEEETGYIIFDWPVPAGVTKMPLDRFKINSVGTLTFSVCAEIVSGDNLVQAWHSDDAAIKVVAHLEPESGGGEDPEEQATNAQKIAALQRKVGAISSGAPPTADSTAEMDPDISTTYINTTDGHLYFWDGSDWQIGGIYGANIVDDTVSEAGMAAEAAAVRAALNAKADADDLTALDARVSAVEGLDETVNGITVLNYTEGKNITKAGVIVDDETSCLSELIPVTWTWDSSTYNRFYFYKAEGDPDNKFYIIFYDANENFLGFKGSYNTDNRNVPGFDGTAYVRFSFHAGTFGKITDGASTPTITYWEAEETLTQKGLVQSMGDLDDLETTDKDSLISAINEVAGVADDVEALDVRVSRDHDAVFKETTVETSGTGTATAGTTIRSQTHIIDVEIPSGSTYRFVLNTTGNPFTTYHFYANNTNVRSNCYPGTEYEFTASADITWVSIYVASENVLADGQFTGVITKVTYNEDSFEERIESVEAGASDIDLLKGMVDANVLLYSDEYEIGANINNDSGNTNYIFHRFEFAIDDWSGKVGVICDSIENATNARPVEVRFFDSGNTEIQKKVFSAEQVHDGISDLPPDDAVKCVVLLYPSITGGLTEETAKYKNVFVFVSNDGRLSPKKQFVTNPFQIPYYYEENDYIQNKIDTIEGLIADSDGNCDVFFFCTDQHWTLNAKQSPNLINHICQQIPIPRMFMGGDYADGLDLNAYKAYRDAYHGRIYSVIGNHEFFDNFTPLGGIIGQRAISNGDIYAYINSHLTDAISDNIGRGYYYVDNPVQKMRYIILSIFNDAGGTLAVNFEPEQKTWLQNDALNLPSGYTAVIFAHVLYTVNYDTGAVVSTAATSDILSVVDNYSGDGEIACMVAGHTHIDGMTVTPSGIPVFITTCDKSGAWISSGTDREPWLTANRHKGTITEQAFDVVVIDKTNRLISFVRIGAKADNGTDAKLEIRQQTY